MKYSPGLVATCRFHDRHAANGGANENPSSIHKYPPTGAAGGNALQHAIAGAPTEHNGAAFMTYRLTREWLRSLGTGNRFRLLYRIAAICSVDLDPASREYAFGLQAWPGWGRAKCVSFSV